MKAISNTGELKPPDQPVAVFSDVPCPAGEQFEIVSRSGQVLNIALAEKVIENKAAGQKYIVYGKVIA